MTYTMLINSAIEFTPLHRGNIDIAHWNDNTPDRNIDTVQITVKRGEKGAMHNNLSSSKESDNYIQSYYSVFIYFLGGKDI